MRNERKNMFIHFTLDGIGFFFFSNVHELIETIWRTKFLPFDKQLFTFSSMFVDRDGKTEME